jgi:nitrogenase molybdenum-iron protein beta chain
MSKLIERRRKTDLPAAAVGASSEASFIERPRYLCPLGGAMMAVTALPDTIPIIHAAPGCAGNIIWAQNGGSGLQVGGYCGGLSVPSSNVQEREVVFGGGERLREEIRNALDVIDGRLFFVLTGCVTEVIGDDVRAVVSEFQDEGVEIIYAETAGFKGDSYRGYDLVLQSLLRNYAGPAVGKVRGRNAKAKKARGKVNLLGIAPFMDVFWRGNLEGLRSLLGRLGLEVNSFFTPADSLDGIRSAAEAELNIVVSDVYGTEAARASEELYGTPYLALPLPIGPAATDLFLRQVGDALGLDRQKVERVIDEENGLYFHYLEPLVECYNDLDLQRYSVVVGDASYSVALAKFLTDDLGWLPELVVCTDRLDPEQQNLIKSRLADLESGLKPHMVFETDTSEIVYHLNRHRPRSHGQKYYHAFNPAFVVGSSLDRELALSLGAPHLSVSFPVANRAVLDRGYTGYRGGLRLIEDLVSAIIAGR